VDHHLRLELDAEQDLLRVDSRFVARRPLAVIRAEGSSLHVANDRFNGYERRFDADAGTTILHTRAVLVAGAAERTRDRAAALAAEA